MLTKRGCKKLPGTGRFLLRTYCFLNLSNRGTAIESFIGSIVILLGGALVVFIGGIVLFIGIYFGIGTGAGLRGRLLRSGDLGGSNFF